MEKSNKLLGDLIQIIRRLRAPDGCPWDRRQTPSDVKDYLTEELYEVLEAIDNDDGAHIMEETGDLMFMLLFLVNLYEEKGVFRLSDSLERIKEKMIHRHPHVFADVKVDSVEQVKDNWQELKVREGKKPRESILDGIPRNLPALSRAWFLTQKAARVGFDWETPVAVLEKVREETAELEEALAAGRSDAAAAELGDMIFSMVNLGRHLGVEPEQALRCCNERFVERFGHIEKSLKAQGRDLKETPLAEMDALWEQAKKNEES
ncbi:MAG: nucleoside triphosphate pyrophosphohydrolase [Deltaproteobacteria bacterium]|nr:nucleoside triphosphate pyrophosphohydrolase [Deltaproteobacteria bacterium]